MARPGYEADRYRVMVMDWAGGGARNLTENWDRSPGNLVWTPDGSALYASADNIGNHSIFSIDPADGARGRLGGGLHGLGSRDGRAAGAAERSPTADKGGGLTAMSCTQRTWATTNRRTTRTTPSCEAVSQ